MIFRLSLFTVHVRPVLSPCQAGGYNISHVVYSHAYFMNNLYFYRICFSTALQGITGSLLDIFIMLILHSIKYYHIINVSLSILYIDLQILNFVLCYILLIMHFCYALIVYNLSLLHVLIRLGVASCITV